MRHPHRMVKENEHVVGQAHEIGLCMLLLIERNLAYSVS
jgi:hypothetical protein